MSITVPVIKPRIKCIMASREGPKALPWKDLGVCPVPHSKLGLSQSKMQGSATWRLGMRKVSESEVGASIWNRVPSLHPCKTKARQFVIESTGLFVEYEKVPPSRLMT